MLFRHRILMINEAPMAFVFTLDPISYLALPLSNELCQRAVLNVSTKSGLPHNHSFENLVSLSLHLLFSLTTKLQLI